VFWPAPLHPFIFSLRSYVISFIFAMLPLVFATGCYFPPRLLRRRNRRFNCPVSSGFPPARSSHVRAFLFSLLGTPGISRRPCIPLPPRPWCQSCFPLNPVLVLSMPVLFPHFLPSSAPLFQFLRPPRPTSRVAMPLRLWITLPIFGRPTFDFFPSSP